MAADAGRVADAARAVGSLGARAPVLSGAGGRGARGEEGVREDLLPHARVLRAIGVSVTGVGADSALTTEPGAAVHPPRAGAPRGADERGVLEVPRRDAGLGAEMAAAGKAARAIRAARAARGADATEGGSEVEADALGAVQVAGTGLSRPDGGHRSRLAPSGGGAAAQTGRTGGRAAPRDAGSGRRLANLDRRPAVGVGLARRVWALDAPSVDAHLRRRAVGVPKAVYASAGGAVAHLTSCGADLLCARRALSETDPRRLGASLTDRTVGVSLADDRDDSDASAGSWIAGFSDVALGVALAAPFGRADPSDADLERPAVLVRSAIPA